MYMEIRKLIYIDVELQFEMSGIFQNTTTQYLPMKLTIKRSLKH